MFTIKIFTKPSITSKYGKLVQRIQVREALEYHLNTWTDDSKYGSDCLVITSIDQPDMDIWIGKNNVEKVIVENRHGKTIDIFK